MHIADDISHARPVICYRLHCQKQNPVTRTRRHGFKQKLLDAPAARTIFLPRLCMLQPASLQQEATRFKSRPYRTTQVFARTSPYRTAQVKTATRREYASSFIPLPIKRTKIAVRDDEVDSVRCERSHTMLGRLFEYQVRCPCRSEGCIRICNDTRICIPANYRSSCRPAEEIGSTTGRRCSIQNTITRSHEPSSQLISCRTRFFLDPEAASAEDVRPGRQDFTSGGLRHALV